MDKIKLVIWDLDETFWKGTLSEEGIHFIQDNINLVKELTDRGIINSICSKNDFEQVKEKLTEIGLWEYFIFPSINWGPKGVAIKHIIEDCQLRDVNVLFLDDNHLNIKEAKFYNPNLQAEFPDFIPQILAHKAFKGKNDLEHSRLKQYKILEVKSSAKESFDDNIKFLESSNIKIEFLRNERLKANIDRTVELLNRTNQLNFTKIRSNEQEVKELVDNNSYDCALIRVVDDFGDYGIVGFYAFHRENGHLEHFTFSCRILNLGVAQFVYAYLDFPSLNIVPEVAEKLDRSTPSWISEIQDQGVNGNSIKQDSKKPSAKIFLKGGCDLSQMVFYLKGNVDVFEETNYVGDNNFPIHQEHTRSILDSKLLSDENKQSILDSEYLPFVDGNYYKTKLFDLDYDCLVFSVLMDYTQEQYIHREKDIKLPFGGYYNLWSEEKNDKQLLEAYTKKSIPIEADTFQKFRQHFKHLGQISPTEFIENLTKIRSLIPENIPIIFINGAELPSPNEKEESSYDRHVLMNKALDDFISNSENTHLLDVRKIVVDTTMISNNLRHYNRESYRKLSINLLSLFNEVLDKKIETKLNLKTRLKEKSTKVVSILRLIKRTIMR